MLLYCEVILDFALFDRISALVQSGEFWTSEEALSSIWPRSLIFFLPFAKFTKMFGSEALLFLASCHTWLLVSPHEMSQRSRPHPGL